MGKSTLSLCFEYQQKIHLIKIGRPTARKIIGIMTGYYSAKKKIIALIGGKDIRLFSKTSKYI